MKKIYFLFFMILPILIFNSSCNDVNNSNQIIPSFEELLEINTYNNILQEHGEFYIKNQWLEMETNNEYIEEMLFMQGDGKVNYHAIRKNITKNEEIFTVSRDGNYFYYSPSVGNPMAILELGELSFLDEYLFILPELISGNVVGKGYYENNYIVYHTSRIIEGTDDYPAKRNDCIYYFNQETKLLEKVDDVQYNNNNKVTNKYTIEFDYDVEKEEIFAETIYSNTIDSDKCIDLEIIMDYGTNNQKSYSFVSMANMQILVSYNYSIYDLYTDCEFNNKIFTLDDYEGLKNLTLYTKFSYSFD